MKEDLTNEQSSMLRKKAEQHLQREQSSLNKKLSEAELLKLIYELEVHQIELEMQNEELILAKERAEQAETEYTELYDYAPTGYLSLDKDGVLQSLNLSAAKMLGKERERLIACYFGFFILDEYLPIFNAFLQKVYTDKSKETANIVLHTENENLLSVQISGTLCQTGEFCLITMVDISELKQSEQKLQQSEERFKRITAGVTDYLYTVTLKNGEVIETKHDETCCNVTGYTAKELLADPFLWLNMIVPEDKKKVLDSIANIKDGGTNKPLDLRIICKNGEIRWINNAIIPKYDGSGEMISYEGVIKDISERKQAEQKINESEIKLKEIINQIYDGIVVFDEKGTIVIWNKGAEAILGISAEHALHKSVADIQYQLLPPHLKDKEYIENTLKNIISFNSSNIFNRNIDVNIVLPNTAQLRTIQIQIFPIMFKEHNLFSLVIRDNTDLKKIENQLVQLNADKDRFISILAHDLSSPFNSILGFLDLLTENIRIDDLDTIERQVRIVHNSSKHLFALLQDILLWIRAQSGKLPYEPKTINLMAICEKVQDSLSLNAQNKNITINLDDVNGLFVFADADMLKMILRNLISNALKFTNQGGNIVVSANQNETHTIISISDNGVGMMQDRIATLFNIGEINSTNGTAHEKGTGLGLLLCKEFVEKHGGKIWVESELGLGSKVTFLLPLIKE